MERQTVRQDVPATIGCLSAIIATLGTEDFCAGMTRALEELTACNSCVVLAFAPERAPHLIAHRSSLSPTRFHELYLPAAYRHDPFFQAAVTRRPIGVSRCSDIAAGDFRRSEYFSSYYRDTSLSEEIGMLCPVDGGETVHISLARCHGSPGFEERVWDSLHTIEPALAALIRKHAALRPGFRGEEAERTGAPCQSWLKHYNATRREIEVASLVLRGHTNGSIALILGISEDTVKVHRKRLYGKLSISSQAELFMLSMERAGSREPSRPLAYPDMGIRSTTPCR